MVTKFESRVSHFGSGKGFIVNHTVLRKARLIRDIFFVEKVHY